MDVPYSYMHAILNRFSYLKSKTQKEIPTLIYFKLSKLSHPTQFHFSPSNPFLSICNNLFTIFFLICSANVILSVTIYLTFIFYMQSQKN